MPKKTPKLEPEPVPGNLPSSRRISFTLSVNEESLLAEICEPITIMWSEERHQTVRKLALYGAFRLLMEQPDVFAEVKRAVSCMGSLVTKKKGPARNESIRLMRMMDEVMRRDQQPKG